MHDSHSVVKDMVNVHKMVIEWLCSHNMHNIVTVRSNHMVTMCKTILWSKKHTKPTAVHTT